ncbi:MAG: leucine-rich repeat protein [Bacteroides sp.]|nr:leucine-rich repeat protein [Bacteroides sp.]
MKPTLQRHAERLRYFAMLLVVALSVTSAYALESDDINTAILASDSKVVKWTDDPTHPWILETSNGETYVRTSGDETSFVSSITATYTSTYPTKLTIGSFFAYGSGNSFNVIIDDNDTELSTGDQTYTFTLSPGTHEIIFQYTATSPGTEYCAAIKKLRVWECKELETQALKQGSLPLTFENDPEHPWIAEDGYIYSTTEYITDVTSTISTTFTIEKASLFTFEHRNSYERYGYTEIKIDGICYYTYTNTDWNYQSIVLYPGTHTVEFENTQEPEYSVMRTEIRNVCLDQTWYDITLTQPGTLGTRLLQALGDKNLQDAELVKITGSINEDDWGIIRQLTGIKAIDFTETDITAIPESAFSGKSSLSTLMLPETLKEIGDRAFYNTDFHQINIPSSVEIIGHEAWLQTPLMFITFPENSNLKAIGEGAFYQTNIIEFSMPNSVTELGTSYFSYYYHTGSTSQNYSSNTFASCYNLKKVHLSDGLTFVPNRIFYNCTNLEEVHLPVNATIIEDWAFYNTNSLKSIELPETLTAIGDDAFYDSGLENIIIPKDVTSYGSNIFENCTNLKTVHLNSHCWDMNYTFRNCTALETVVLPCATPPSITDDPFYDVTRSNITLIVPDFALESYRADSYWYNFTKAQAGDEASLNDYWAIRGNLTLDNSHTMQATPSLEIMTGGVLNMDTDVQQNFNEFTYNNMESAPGSYLSESNSVSATKLITRFYVESANKWYFFSPVCDVKMSDITYPATDSWVIRYYDGASRAANNDNSGNWKNVPADGTLLRGQGYIIQANVAGWLEMPVEADKYADFFGSNAVTLPLEDNPSEGAANAGWNFVANPYPCYYDIYYLDMQAPITVWNGSTYVAYSLNDGDRGDDTFVLRPMQPYFVQKASADLTAGMPLTGRRVSTVIDRTRAPRRAAAENAPSRELLNLTLSVNDNESADDRTRIVLNETASMDYELICDASKFISLDNTVAQIYSIGNDNTQMAINERPYDNGIVALGVYLPVNGETYRISATRADRQAWLYDAELGIEHDLTTADYVFTSSKNGFDNKRFSVRFSPVSTGVKSVMEGTVKVTGNNGYLTVTAPAGADITVYSTDGSVITNTITDSAALDINVAAGVYVVKVNEESFKTIVK